MADLYSDFKNSKCRIQYGGLVNLMHGCAIRHENNFIVCRVLLIGLRYFPLQGDQEKEQRKYAHAARCMFLCSLQLQNIKRLWVCRRNVYFGAYEWMLV